MGKHFCDTTQAWWHLHTHLFGKVVCAWCVGIVVALLAPSSLASTPSLSHSFSLSHLITHVSVTFHSIPPFAFSIPLLFLVCVWDCDVAFTLSLWLLVCLCCHLCPPFLGLMVPRFLHCLCAHAFLHCPCHHNNLAPFLCGFWCAPQGTPSISTERGGKWIVVLSCSKSEP